MNKENLLKLADYLEGPLKAKFDMAVYCDMDGTWANYSATDCGSVGCAIGHAPFLGITKRSNESWGTYARRAFEISFEEQMFLFDSGWAIHLNDPKETARRIRWFTTNGGIPEGWLNDFEWKPSVPESKQEAEKPKADLIVGGPEVETPKPKERIVYVTVDSAVRELQETIGEN